MVENTASFGNDKEYGPPLWQQAIANITEHCIKMSKDANQMGLMSASEAIETAVRSACINGLRLFAELLKREEHLAVRDLLDWHKRCPEMDVTILDDEIDEPLDDGGSIFDDRYN